ncbi:MAG: hypothetical protein K0R57_5791 [Paenibacillaceae bacterium]|jgi:hypothetical protein|nr:hypothetical protein [Paenibacillaceae bacterium]
MTVYRITAGFCLFFVLLTVELIRRRRIEERYAILWLTLGLCMSLFSFFPALLEGLSRALHVYYAPSLLFLMGLLVCLAFIMHLTMVISKQHRRLTRLAQELALLRAERRSEGRIDEALPAAASLPRILEEGY